MTKREYLEKEKNDILYECSEVANKITTLKVRKTNYENVLLLKDHRKRFKEMASHFGFSSLLICAGVFGLEIILAGFFKEYQDILKLLPTILSINLGIHGFNAILEYQKDKKQYFPKLSGQFYMDMNIEELKEKVAELEREIFICKHKYEKLKSVLEYVKEQIQEIDETETEFLEKKHELEKIPLVLPIKPEKVIFNIMDTPKVKLKRRNENVTKA